MQFTNILYKIFCILFIIYTEKNTVCMSGRERERERETITITIYIEKSLYRKVYKNNLCRKMYKNL